MPRSRPILLILSAAMLALLSVSLASAQTTLSTTLSGDEEVPPADKNAKGFISLEFSADGVTVCYTAKLQAIQDDTLVAGHIHEEEEGQNGPVVLDLRPTAADRHGNRLSNCVTDTTGPNDVADILADPSEYYVNFHTNVYPGGALRGQLGD